MPELFLWQNSPSKASSVFLTEIVMCKVLVEQELNVTAAVSDLRTISFSQGRAGDKILILQNTSIIQNEKSSLQSSPHLPPGRVTLPGLPLVKITGTVESHYMIKVSLSIF